MKLLNNFVQYLKDVRSEMIKVSWPSREDIVGATTVVLAFSISMAVVVKVFDYVLSSLLGLILKM